MTDETSEHPAQPAPGRRRWLVAAGLLAGLGGLVVALNLTSNDPGLPASVTSEHRQEAERLFQARYGRQPQHVELLLAAGELAVSKDRLAVAADCFHEIPDDDRRFGRSARLQEGQVLQQLHRATESEQSFRKFLAMTEFDRSTPPAHKATAWQWLVFLLSVELRFEERKSALAQMHAHGFAGIWESKLYYFPNLLVWNSPKGRTRLRQFLEQDPLNIPLRTAEARYLALEGKVDEAVMLLKELRKQAPDDLRSLAVLLECYFERDDRESFADVAGALPEFHSDEPWLLTRMRGRFAMDKQEWSEAARHFEHVLEQDPAHPACNMELARVCARLGRDERRQELQDRSLVLADIRVNLVNVNESQPEVVLQLAEQCDSIGMPDAADTFRKHASRVQPTIERPPSSESTRSPAE